MAGGAGTNVLAQLPQEGLAKQRQQMALVADQVAVADETIDVLDRRAVQVGPILAPEIAGAAAQPAQLLRPPGAQVAGRPLARDTTPLPRLGRISGEAPARGIAFGGLGAWCP